MVANARLCNAGVNVNEEEEEEEEEEDDSGGGGSSNQVRCTLKMQDEIGVQSGPKSLGAHARKRLRMIDFRPLTLRFVDALM